MNNRWKYFAEQCMDQRLDGLHFDKEMFAELIVRECARKVTRNEALNIFEHFGVKHDESRTY